MSKKKKKKNKNNDNCISVTSDPSKNEKKLDYVCPNCGLRCGISYYYPGQRMILTTCNHIVRKTELNTLVSLYNIKKEDESDGEDIRSQEFEDFRQL